MEKFRPIKYIGQGSFGVVYAAQNKVTGEVVAIKKLNLQKCTSVEECANLIEVKALRKMNHPNIVKLKETIKEKDMLLLIFECMECSLYDRMRGRLVSMTPFSESEIRNLCFQLFQGLAHMHGNGYFHRDLKPANLLVSKDVIKIADLGQATNGEPPFTDYVTTRAYRAPEVLLRSSVYDPAVDMWAMGAIMAELYTLRPLFQGGSAPQVMHMICGVIGSPTESKWSEGLDLARKYNYEFPDVRGMPLAALLPCASHEALSLIATLLSWNPRMRPTAMEALEHPFFHSCSDVPPVPLPLRRQTLPAVIQMAIKWDFEMEMEVDPALALFKQTTSCTFGSERVDPFMMETKQESLTSTQSCITESEEVDYPTEYLLHLLSKYQSD